jgi:hypothetical protein
MTRRRSSSRRRSRTRSSGTRGTDERSIEWRLVLLTAPLTYGVGVLAGDLLAVTLLGVSTWTFVSDVGVLAACVLLSAGLGRLIKRYERSKPRSIGSISSPRTSIRTGAAVLVPAFLFGLGLAALA